MEEQLAARRRVATELQAQLQSRAETMAARPLRGPRTPACLKPSMGLGAPRALAHSLQGVLCTSGIHA